MKKKTTVQILKEARAIVSNGWTKFTFKEKGEEKYCMSGATRKAAFGAVTLRSKAEQINGQAWQWGNHCLSRSCDTLLIARYNDDPGTRKSDVLDVFDKAIKLAEKEEKS